MMRYLFVFIVMFLVFSSCDNSSEQSNVNSTLVEAQVVAKLSSDDVQQILLSAQTLSQSVQSQALPVFGITVFEVIYKTKDEKGNLIEVSGLVAYPDVKSVSSPVNPDFKSPIISDQHGTIFLNNEAPTVAFKNDINTLVSGNIPPDYQFSTTFQLVIQYTALLGLTSVFPDYIGYGKSVDHFHTYMLEESLANSVIDLILASIELAKTFQIPVKKDVYLAGYSEGGYSTMAAAKKLQENNRGLNVKGVYPMGGVYNLEVMGLGIVSSEYMSFPPFPAYVAYSYGETYDNISLQLLVNDEFVDLLPSLFDKTKDSLYIYGAMFNAIGKDPQNDIFIPSDLFRPEVIVNFIEDENNPFRTDLRMNNVDDWVPSFNMTIFHCSGDDILPYNLAFQTYQKFINSGAKNVNMINPEEVFGTLPLTHTECAYKAYPLMINLVCNSEYGFDCIN